ncbi:MAG: hypothetical protein IPJ29_15230 [Chitinophagaceae bacterium]|nr:hypothetical protein [Chitinophagaceae bacterium]
MEATTSSASIANINNQVFFFSNGLFRVDTLYDVERYKNIFLNIIAMKEVLPAFLFLPVRLFAISPSKPTPTPFKKYFSLHRPRSIGFGAASKATF